MFNNYISWLVISVFRRVPLCHPLLTMQSVCAVLVALAATALSSADPDMHRPRHDSNLEICILLLSVGSCCQMHRHACGCERVCLCGYVHASC